MLSLLRSLKPTFRHVLVGDWFTVMIGAVMIVYLFQNLWSHEHASKVQIRIGDKVYGTYDLNQQRDIKVHGAIGNAEVHIAQGKVRFAKSPCHNQYCVHQGWLTHSGQAAICLPNQVSLELVGQKKPYDSLNY